jgi:hypothetical protein
MAMRHCALVFLTVIAFGIPLCAQSTSSDDVQVTVLDAPDFKGAPASKLPENPPVSLRLVSSKANKITDVDDWFARNHLLLNEHRGDLPAAMPREIHGAPVRRTIVSGGHILAIYGADFSKTLFVVGATEDGNVEYAFDFSNYRLAPRNIHTERNYVEQRIVWAEQEGDVLYVSHGHSTYASSSYGMNGYVSAIDVRTGKALWHSAPMVSNSRNFTFLGDSYLVTGYGFTAEPDHLYLLRAKDGVAIARVPVKSRPEYILPYRDRVWVRTYNTDYVFNVVGKP